VGLYNEKSEWLEGHLGHTAGINSATSHSR
jgi:hypothetical protein